MIPAAIKSLIKCGCAKHFFPFQKLHTLGTLDTKTVQGTDAKCSGNHNAL